MNIIEKLNSRIDGIGSFVCVGLDSEITKIPARFQQEPEPQFTFNRWVIEETHPYTAAYKLNAAFYEARGEQGWYEMRKTTEFLRQKHPEIVTICDAKRGDMSSTNDAYVTAIFDVLGFDAITLHPYLGSEGLKPFLDRADKGNIILCRTSNPGAREIQDLIVEGKPLWQVVAERVSHEWNANQNCMLVVGATYPDEMRQIRQVAGDIPFLVPGVGVQGGDVQQVVQAGLNSEGKGLIISASRSIIFADSPSAAAKNMHTEISQAIRDTKAL